MIWLLWYVDTVDNGLNLQPPLMACCRVKTINYSWILCIYYKHTQRLSGCKRYVCVKWPEILCKRFRGRRYPATRDGVVTVNYQWRWLKEEHGLMDESLPVRYGCAIFALSSLETVVSFGTLVQLSGHNTRMSLIVSAWWIPWFT